MFAALAAAVDPSAPWERQVDQALGAYLDAVVSRPALFRSFVRELPALGERGAAHQLAAIESFARQLVDLVEQVRREQGGLGAGPLGVDQAIMIVGGVRELMVIAAQQGRDLREATPRDRVRRERDRGRRRRAGLADVHTERPRRLRLRHLGLLGSGPEDVIADRRGDAEPVVLVLVVVQPVAAPDRAVVAAMRPVRGVDQEVTPLVRAEDRVAGQEPGRRVRRAGRRRAQRGRGMRAPRPSARSAG